VKHRTYEEVIRALCVNRRQEVGDFKISCPSVVGEGNTKNVLRDDHHHLNMALKRRKICPTLVRELVCGPM
jgi:hypothetical protein